MVLFSCYIYNILLIPRILFHTMLKNLLALLLGVVRGGLFLVVMVPPCDGIGLLVLMWVIVGR